jgi:hypothetical protein
MPQNWNFTKTFVAGTVLAASDLNNLQNDVGDNFTPAGLEGTASATATSDPSGGTAATSAQTELYYLRNQVDILNDNIAAIPVNNFASENLIVKQASNSTVDIDADMVALRATTLATQWYGVSNIHYATSVNLTADITASGANGLDTGSESSGSATWYYIYVIYNGSTVASLLSLSNSSPTMPSGYTHRALVGAVLNNASDNFDDFDQLGRDAWWTSRKAGLNNGSSLTYASVDLSDIVPATAKAVYIELFLNTSGGSGTMTASVSWDGTNAHGRAWTHQSAPANQYNAMILPLVTAQTLWYLVDDTNADLDINVVGWKY